MVDGYGGALYNKLIYYLIHGGTAFMWIAKDWQDYELLDCGGGEKLERWDKQILVRPDPQAIWETDRRDRRWKTANARYSRSSTGGGHWDKSKLPESWPIHYKELTFQVKPMNFKHTGLFPEQAANWDFAMEQIRTAGRPIRVLNLFAYTGGATVACAKAGASVCHVDAAKGMVAWKTANARYSRSSTGGGHWDKSKLPESWPIHYKELTFQVKPMNFKHTGLFPEQAANWDFAMEQIRTAGRPIRVLNLFAYTGGATVACAKAGASVCHVDAAKGMVAWAKDNARLSGLADAPIRWIVDDCAKFVEREIRRGKTYDAIIMDPPSYGRGPSGEVWKLEENLYPFVRLCAQVLSDNPLFVILNSYTTGLAPSVLGYILQMLVGRRFGGHVTWDELGLPCTDSGMALPCGATGRWCAD